MSTEESECSDGGLVTFSMLDTVDTIEVSAVDWAQRPSVTYQPIQLRGMQWEVQYRQQLLCALAACC
jgi:hypothetical protein